MMKKATWDRSAYPACTSITNSYYYKYNKVADSREAFGQALSKELEKKSPVIELKVTDDSKNACSDLSAFNHLFSAKSVTGYRYSIIEDVGVIRISNIKYY
jgi:hypothetical protein